MCKNGGTTLCGHSSEEVLDYPEKAELEDKINSQCDGVCQQIKRNAEEKVEDIDKNADYIFGSEEEESSQTIQTFDNMANAFDILSASEDEDFGDDTSQQQQVNTVNQNFQNQLLRSNLNDEDKKDLQKDADDAAKSGKLKNFRAIISAKVLAKRARERAKQGKIQKKRIAFKAKMVQMKNGLKAIGTPGNIGKASFALAGGAKGLSKFMTARRPDGSIDEKQVIGGVLDVIHGLSTFLPAPGTVVTGNLGILKVMCVLPYIQ